jgi:hypothetical protein
MTRKPLPTSRGGVAGMALLFCVSAGGAGLAFDLLRDAPGAFWLLAEPGGRAALGAGAVTAIVLIAHAARWLLARRTEKGGRDAGDYP